MSRGSPDDLSSSSEPFCSPYTSGSDHHRSSTRRRRRGHLGEAVLSQRGHRDRVCKLVCTRVPCIAISVGSCELSCERNDVCIPCTYVSYSSIRVTCFAVQALTPCCACPQINLL